MHDQSVTIEKKKTKKENTSFVVTPLNPMFVNLTVTDGPKSDELYGNLRASHRRSGRENGRKPLTPQEPLPPRVSTHATISFYNITKVKRPLMVQTVFP